MLARRRSRISPYSSSTYKKPGGSIPFQAIERSRYEKYVRLCSHTREERGGKKKTVDTYQYYLGVASSSGCALIAGAGATR